MIENFQVRVPQMGEGLQFATVVRVLKGLGEWAAEDDDVVEVETEKAILGISTPVAGTVCGVSCRPGDKVHVGDLLLEIGAKKAHPLRSTQVRKGDAAAIGAPRRTLPEKQLTLIRHMNESRDIVIPASMEFAVDWTPIDTIKRTGRAMGDGVPSATEIIGWAAARAMQRHEKFRARLSPANELHISAESHIGIAVAADDDVIDMRVAAIGAHDGWPVACDRIRRALSGDSTAGTYHSLAISDMSSLQITRALPVVVYPAVATLFVGAPGRGGGAGRSSAFVLTFDHRVMNGVYAAGFLKSVDAGLRHLASEISTPERMKENAAAVAKTGT